MLRIRMNRGDSRLVGAIRKNLRGSSASIRAINGTKRPVQLSILLPTHRHDLAACSRVFQACSWASRDIEVLVRDNSGNERKRALLGQIQQDNCRVILSEPCSPLENLSELFRLAKGEFVFCFADDDGAFDRGIAALPGIIARIAKDRSIVGVSGLCLLEAAQGSTVINYQGIDADDVGARVTGYLGEPGPNVLYFSALRRTLVERVMAFLQELPLPLSYHDQIMCLLYLLSGKFVRLPRLLYVYDFGAWETAESAQQRDVSFYVACGLDPAINVLHWFLCGFEGAVLALKSSIVPDHLGARRQDIANHWFTAMFARFNNYPRMTFGSPFAIDVAARCEKLKTLSAPISFDAILKEITGILTLVSSGKAQNYFDYWDAVINNRVADTHQANVLKVAAAGQS